MSVEDVDRGDDFLVGIALPILGIMVKENRDSINNANTIAVRRMPQIIFVSDSTSYLVFPITIE